MNQSERFDQLPWFLKEHIHRNRWSGFREVQLKAFDVLFGSDSHLLIASGTSSGKTEAAFFPVISSLYSNPTEGIGALYISPLKALIDDQFERLDLVLRDSGIRVTGWHGDIGASSKRAAMYDPSGILQITPESLQGIITNHPDMVRNMFHDLRFIIIDEVHAFMASDRGSQLLCCLDRVQTMAGCDPRRVGLSATISDPEGSKDWLAAGTGRPVGLVICNDVRNQRVSLEYNRFPNTPDEDQEGAEDMIRGRKRAISDYYRRLYEQTRQSGCIVFVNSRETAEKTGRSLMKVCEAMGAPNSISVHHGSVSKELRKGAEDAMRKGASTTVATVTLELGIDIGVLDKVIQIDPPYTCSSLVQRMGRSGRRSSEQVLTMFCNDDDDKWWTTLEGVSMNLVKAIAMLDLCINDGWVEPSTTGRLPYGLLWQQTMAYLKSTGGARFTELAGSVLSMYPFGNISKDDYKVLIRHMVSEGHLEFMPDKTLIIGLKGEPIAFGRDFCTVFRTKREVEVKSEGKSVGTIQNMPDPGDLILLAGRVWSVVTVHRDTFSIEVVPSEAEAVTPWKSGIPPTDTRIIRRMRDVLFGDAEYPWLDEASRKRLAECRVAARFAGMDRTFRDNEDGTVTVWPWLGTVQFDTLRRVLDRIGVVLYSMDPFCITLQCESPDSLALDIEEFIIGRPLSALMKADDMLFFGKYDNFVPEVLLRKQFAADRLDTSFELL